MIPTGNLDTYVGRRVMVTMSNPGGQYIGRVDAVAECAAKLPSCRHLLLVTDAGVYWTLQSRHIVSVAVLG